MAHFAVSPLLGERDVDRFFVDIHPHEHATFHHDLPPLYVARRVTLIGVAQPTMYYVRQVSAPTAILSRLHGAHIRRGARLTGMPTLQVQLEERDYVNAARAAAKASKRTIIVLAVASVLVVVAGVVGWRAGYMREAFIAGFVWFFALIGAWIGHMLSVGPKAKRVFRQQHGLRRAHEVSWNDVGLTVTGEDGQATTRWADFHKSRELDDQFILFFSDAAILMIPKRAFTDSGLLRDFRESVARRIPRR